MALKPNVVLVGAAKAGTTSIYSYLKEHPQVFLPPEMKEINFLGGLNPAVRNEADYLALYRGAEVFPVRLDISTAYLYDPAAPERIRDFLGPEVKIIAFLRDPVDASYSMWKQIRHFGDETLSFEEALVAEEQRRHNPVGLRGWAPNYFYQDRSRYAPQLRRYYDVFSTSQIKIFIFEEFFADVERGWRELCAFLDIDAAFAPKNLGNIYNPGSSGHRVKFLNTLIYRDLKWKKAILRFIPTGMKSKLKLFLDDLNKKNDEDTLPPSVRRQLASVFASDVTAVEEMTGHSLKGIWLKS